MVFCKHTKDITIHTMIAQHPTRHNSNVTGETPCVSVPPFTIFFTMSDTAIILNSLPRKSAGRYTSTMIRFRSFCRDNNYSDVDEGLQYYVKYLREHQKVNSIRCIVSQIKKVCINNKTPLKDETLEIIYGYLKAEGKTEAPKKSLVLKEGDITTFLRSETNGLKDLQLKVALIVGFFCALRNGELYDIRRGDISEDHDFECFNVCVKRSKTDQAGCGFSAAIPFSIGDISLVSILREYLKSLDFFILQHRLDALQQPFFTAISAQGAFMLSRVGVNSMAKMASRIAEKLGLENAASYTGHCFRGSAATNMAENGASDQQMKSLCRWKSEKMADVYTRKTERLKKEATKTLLKKTAHDTAEPSTIGEDNSVETAVKR